MSLAEKIEKDYLIAYKAKETEKVSTLRMVKAALANYKIDKNKEKIEDAEALQIIQKEVKQRNESLECFKKAGRADLAKKEAEELKILAVYMPKQLSDEEIKTLAQKAVASSGAKSKADAGKVMKELMPQVKGKADGKRVNQIVMSLLN